MMYLNKLEEIKKQRKITNSDLGKVISLTRQAIDSKMNGKTDFYVSELISLAKFLNIPVASFFEETNNYVTTRHVFEALERVVSKELNK